jgi:Ca-activated chloride channel family protein
MTFERPYLLLSLLVIVLAVLFWLWAERRRMRYAVRFTNLEVLASVAGGRQWTRFVPPALVALSLAALSVALARPHVNRMVANERATVILVLDTSRSMQATDVQPTRLGAAQQALRLFLDSVPERLRVGFVIFAGEAQVATPPTADHDLVGQSVDSAGEFLIYGGTAIGDALQTAVELGKRAVDQQESEGQVAAPGSTRGTRTLAQATVCDEESLVSILFLSDGAQTRGLLQPLEGAQLAKDANFPVYTIALGTPEGVIERGPFGGFGQDSGELIPVPPDPATLRAIAETTGGEFSEARDAEALEAAYANLGSRLGREPGESEITWVFLVIGGVLLLLAAGVATVVSPRFA